MPASSGAGRLRRRPGSVRGGQHRPPGPGGRSRTAGSGHRSGRRRVGTTAENYVLVAFDFARAYDVVDRQLLRVSLIEQGLPLCLCVRWVWQWLRDRRVKVEVNGTLSGQRIFRAGLPQGSVLSPGLCCGRHLKKVPRCFRMYMYREQLYMFPTAPSLLPVQTVFKSGGQDLPGSPRRRRPCMYASIYARLVICTGDVAFNNTCRFPRRSSD